jgi:P4 family phage/plasmid primase-like protien
MKTIQMFFYKSKKECLKSNVDNKLVASFAIKKYFISKDYESFLNLIVESKVKQYFEYIRDTVPVKLFFDIEIFKDKNLELFTNFGNIIELIENIYGNDFILLESHKTQIKMSFHVIFPFIHFRNVKELKKEVFARNEFKELIKEKIIDTSVYREGLFRTLYSSKENEIRPLVYSENSPLKNMDMETFICNITHESPPLVSSSDPLTTNITDLKLYSSPLQKANLDIVNLVVDEISEHHKNIITLFVRINYSTSKITNIRLTGNVICIGLKDKFCKRIKAYHQNNHQFIVINKTCAVQKCHDEDCSKVKWNKIDFIKFPDDLKDFFNNSIKKEQVIDTMQLESAKDECSVLTYNIWKDNVNKFDYDDTNKRFQAPAGEVVSKTYFAGNSCPDGCDVLHFIDNTGLVMQCQNCKVFHPMNDPIQISKRYPTLNVIFNQYNTINNTINNYNSTDPTEYSCKVKLDPNSGSGDFTNLFNQILDGHKICKISALLKEIDSDFVYSHKLWYNFTGSIWKADEECLKLRKSIVEFSDQFEDIKFFYENKNTKTEDDNAIIKNIDSLIIKLNKPGFADEIVKGAKLYFVDEEFKEKLNCKKHLVPFENGVYDLISNEFRSTVKEDYVNLTLRYDYDLETKNPEVYEFIEKILPDVQVRDYVLKKMSECLNGDIPNTNFLMLIGDGANGKSQLLNLMKLTMGQLGEKVEVTLLTRKRGDAASANPEKIKLMHKRFAFLSEPEDGEKINIGLLKELTGSEEIVSRGLYEASTCFVMETKLFLACNELPEIKGEDNAIWRRIRVIDFPSRFVDEPKGNNEYLIDRSLPSRMRDDITWRQTFLNILIDYYPRIVKEPESVKTRTNNYRVDNNETEQWIIDNVEYKLGAVLYFKDLVASFKPMITNPKAKGKFKPTIEKALNKIFSLTYPSDKNYIADKVGLERIFGWDNLSLTV